MNRKKPMRDFEYLKERVFKKNADLKEFWKLLKEWHADPITKYTADDIIGWMDDFVKNPKDTLAELKQREKEYEND